MRRLTRPLWILLAVVFLVEAWLWEHVRPLVARVVDWIAWPALKRRIAAAIERLPPWPTLLVFLIPAALLFPLKLAALWMFSHGYWLGGVAVFGFAKVLGVGVTAFVFDLTRPKLMQLPGFPRLYALVLRGLAWAHGLVDPYKAEVKAWLARTIAPLRARIGRLLRLLAPGRRGRFLRHLRRLRRSVQRGAPRAAPAE
ncbi:hypothetical protein PQJ75_22805 [Rhodoplanes sp. TEM]|uniref:Transmembrane protein n=1 Tax=Rhodoplanes tepidamans TaxID=200616 RepID=A0ABT5JIX2_RHOTP|nr:MULTISPECIES: hypothetical protein [Rhodoplanes]MDC7789306.1 hypothetical protein [Rhodoplanes tepidamans]MDC7986568.1 hypothetical protein [Rhodoplanes sp. TEM]MDQ0359076.1 hypothetical protein [Rhodoplanes tepidamans]